MTAIASSRAREMLTEIINRVAYGGERIVITRRGKTRVAVVSSEDLDLLERLEDFVDVEIAKKRLREMAARGEEGIPLEEVRAELGL